MWVTSSLTLFGLEARALVYGGRPLILLGIVLAFCSSIILIRLLLVLPLYCRLKPAHPLVEEAVRRRAEELGLERNLVIRLYPKGSMAACSASVAVITLC